MKKYKFVLPLALVILMVISCVTIVSNAVNSKKEFESYIDIAHKAAEKKISIDVDEAYNNALNISSQADVYLQWGKYYSDNDDFSTAISIGERGVETFPKSPELYLFLMENYLKIEDYETFFEAYDKCTSTGATNKAVIKLYEDNKYAFSLELDSYDSAFPFSSGVSRVIGNTYSSDEEEYYGYVSASGSINAQYKDAGDFNLDEISVAAVVDKNDEAFYINKQGRKYVVSPDNVQVKKLGYYSSGVLSVYDGKGYYLCDINGSIISGPYDYLSAVNDGIGAVKVGDKWQIINKKGKKIINDSYTDVILDSKEIMYCNGFFAQINGAYYLLNEKGEKVSNASYEDACLFVDGYAAVKNNGKWGFIDKEGKLVVDYIYHDAKSFSNGFAPVKLNGAWGYIIVEDGKPTVAIDYQFEDAVGFSATSYSAMVKSEGKWRLMKLYVQ